MGRGKKRRRAGVASVADPARVRLIRVRRTSAKFPGGIHFYFPSPPPHLPRPSRPPPGGFFPRSPEEKSLRAR